MKPFEIRPLQVLDWEQLTDLDLAVFPDDYITFEVFKIIVEANRFFGLFLDDGELIGQLSLGIFGENAGHLSRIGVKESYQNQGYGSQLMRFAIEWFKKKEVSKIILYTQQDNFHAQHLYKKFGFAITGNMWHYFVPFESISPSGELSCDLIKEREIVVIEAKYPEAFPPTQIRRYLKTDRNKVLVLRTMTGEIVGACRFTPSFPGCHPFIIDRTYVFDDFMYGLQQHSLPQFDYVRIAFSDNEELAQLCHERGYKLHHRLYEMTLHL